MLNGKTLLVSVLAIAVSTTSLVYSGAGHAAEDGFKPSWQAMCGYKWRNSAERAADKSRAAYLAFMRSPDGCGAKGKTNNDDKIKEYMDAHPETVPGKRSDLSLGWIEAKRGKK